MIRFYALLAVVNAACFLPLYALNARTAPNPFAFWRVTDRTARWWPLRVLYVRLDSTDPFRIHFDFTFFALLAVATGYTGPAARVVAALLLASGFVEILYTTLMHLVFKRPPALASDLALLASGLSLAQRQAYWMVPAALVAVALIAWAAWLATTALFALGALGARPALVLATMLLPPCLYHSTYYYDSYLWRTVYSPTLHLWLNLRLGRLRRVIHERGAAHYDRFNHYRGLHLEGAPNIVVVCVESYGSVAYRDPRANAGIAEILRPYEVSLTRCGYHVASAFSEAPLFAGGSWASYASFLYGVRIDDLQLYNGLFSQDSGFVAYESILHVLRRNGYDNVLLCPLGGVDPHAVDWDSVDRCFHSQRRISIEDLGYVGPRLNYLGVVRRFSPLDQFSLNHGYEVAKAGGGPFSLFFCTLNSHYPWHSATEAVSDWRGLNAPATLPPVDPTASSIERYNAAIRYQLDYLLRFVEERAADAPLVILFGDHQPPFITPDHLGTYTPVHVLSRDPTLIDVFVAHGFADTLDLSRTDAQTIRHEGFMSLLMKALTRAYGSEPRSALPYLEHGSGVFDDIRADVTRLAGKRA